MSEKHRAEHRVCTVYWLGLYDYLTARKLQERLVEARARNETGDVLLMMEHPPTYTLGRRGKMEHLRVPEKILRSRGIAVHRVDRGGDITFHGPGQLIGYPVIRIKGGLRGVVRYLRGLEETMMRALAAFGVEAGRIPGLTGVWVGDKKIGAIGIKVNAHGVSGHGFALNVTVDLEHYENIVPCGIPDKGVTSVQAILGHSVPVMEVANEVARAFGEVFSAKMAASARPTDYLWAEICRKHKEEGKNLDGVFSESR